MLNPTDETQLAETVAGATGPLAIRGGGTRPVGGVVDGVSLNISGISGIVLHEPGALTLVAKAGTPLAEVEARLSTENQMLAFEPMDHRSVLGTDGEPTIGGVVAANVSGPRRVQSGACRDFLLGVRFVDGSGNVIKNGGRVMKNVTGYDLTKIMAGSRGTLGILTEVSFKVLPKPETTATLLLDGLSISDAVKAMLAALGSPFEVSAAAHLPAGKNGVPVTMIRIEGFESSVSYRADRLRDLLSVFGPARIERRDGASDEYDTEADWGRIRNAEMFRGTDDDVWRISVKPSEAPKVAAALGDVRLLLDWAGGLIWAGVPEGRDVRAALAEIRGHATLVRASAETKARLGVFQPDPPPLAALASRLRQQFDPKGILNPGLMG